MYKYKPTSEQLSDKAFVDVQLINDYHYIKLGATTINQLKSAGMLPDKSYKGLLKNKPDGLIILGKNTVKVLVEAKPKGILKSVKAASKALTDWYFLLAKEVGCKVICATDGDNTYWFNEHRQLIKASDGKIVKIPLNIEEKSS